MICKSESDDRECGNVLVVRHTITKWFVVHRVHDG